MIDQPFSLLKYSPESIVYQNDVGKEVRTSVDELSLKTLLRQIKTFENQKSNMAIYSYNLRTAILMAGNGTIKSYDVYTNNGTELQSSTEIKSLLIDSTYWIAQRAVIHKKILKKLFKNVNELSQQIDESETLSGLYCIRGTVASGKTTFIENFLRLNPDDNKISEGIINTDNVKRLLIKNTHHVIGGNFSGYLFHDEASAIVKQLLTKAKEAQLLYVLDQRMQEESDIKGLLHDAQIRGLTVTIFDIKVDFITSALRVLNRSGLYPSDPTPDFASLFKNYINIEKGRKNFLSKALKSKQVKDYYSVLSTDKEQPIWVMLKQNFEITNQGKLTLILKAESIPNRRVLENTTLPTGGTVKEALDSHSKKIYKDLFNKKSYEEKVLLNIKDTSRTYNGDLDLSASVDKKDKIDSTLSKDEIVSLSMENTAKAFEYIYNNKNIVLSDPSTLKLFINNVAWIVNQGILLDKKDLLRNGQNSNKYKYVQVDKLDFFYDAFLLMLFNKITNVDCDYIETAAWIEWNIDFNGHIFSDGCGRVAKLISSWLLIRQNKDLPSYHRGQGNYASVRESYRKRFAIRKNIDYKSPTETNEYFNFLKYYKELFTDKFTQEVIRAAGGFVYNSAGKFLILQSNKGKDKGKWVLPGGKLEKGESESRAFSREVYEESGLHAQRIVEIGKRDYVSPRGFRYQLTDYKSIAINEDEIKINSESIGYKWIDTLELGGYQFTDSIRDLFNKYIRDNMLDYYKNVEKVRLEDLDLPDFDKHTMANSLDNYVAGKLPISDLEAFLPYVNKFEVHGIYPDLDIINSLNLNFRVIKVLSSSKVKLDNSNSIRPIFLLAEQGMEKFIVCCTTPGSDLLMHYSSMIGHLLKKYPKIDLSIFSYPIAEQQIDKWTELDRKIIQSGDVVILGYSTFLKKAFLKDKSFWLQSIYENKFYVSTRFKSTSGVVVNCLEANYGHWGSISDYLATKISELGAAEIVHVGKVGTLKSPEDVYKKIYIPIDFAIGRKNDILYPIKTIHNSLAYFKEHTSLTHVSVSTTMEETFLQRNYFNDFDIETIDIESSKIAQGIALHNLHSDFKVKFGSIHFSTDYLRKPDDLNKNFPYDLSTKRIPEVVKKKNKILMQIYQIIKKHIG
jgi:8-oxo-dGTP pyrophosphatase MutT (NUDIX family)